MAKLYFKYAAMNAGKSTGLLQAAHNYEQQGFKVLLYTAAIDDRFGSALITSRLGVQRSAITFVSSDSFKVMVPLDTAGLDVEKVDCILIDEAQFLSVDQVKELHEIAHIWGIPVLCYGLRSDFKGDPFPGSVMLLALADSLEETKTICHCGRKATMNIRLDADGVRVTEGEQVVIGDSTYRQVCGACFYTFKSISDVAKLAKRYTE